MGPPRRRFEVDPDLYPFPSHWLDLDGAPLHYLDEGPEGSPAGGRPVLLLHGNPTWSFLYRDVVRALRGAEAGDLRCLVPDYPGFGHSPPPPGYGFTPAEHARRVGGLVDRLELDGLVLVGQDWGGPIAVAVALERRARVAGLVLANTWCWPPDRRMSLFSRLMGGRGLGRHLQLGRNAFARWVVPAGIHGPARRDPRVLAAYRAPFATRASRLGTWVFPREIRGSRDWLAGLEARLGELGERPVELVWGLRDPAFGHRAYLARWKRRFPHAGVRTLDDASHYLQEDRPDAVAGAVRRLVARLADPPRRRSIPAGSTPAEPKRPLRHGRFPPSRA